MQRHCCSLWHSRTEPTPSSSVFRISCLFTHWCQSRPIHSHLSGYPESVCSDCPWMVPVASCGVMAASLWDKQPLRKGGRTITNQCVRLPDDTQRTGVEAASHFTPKAFWRNQSSLRGWVDGCLLMDWLDWPQSTAKEWWSINTGGNAGWKVWFVYISFFSFHFLLHTMFVFIFMYLIFIGYDAVLSSKLLSGKLITEH